jgi:nitroreductase
MLLEAIAKRRSIRKFLDIPVTDSQVRELLEAAMLAPSAKNGQPWHFVVIRNEETLTRLRENHPYASSLKTARLCICVCGVIDPAMPDYYTQDCAACTQNILLQAAHMGLGACWMGVAPRQERMSAVAEVLQIPEGVAPFCLIAVGVPDEKREMPARFNHTRIHMEKY